MNGIPIRQAAVALAIMLAACDTIPAEQVQFYADSYAQANEAGNRLYDELVEPILSVGAGGSSAIGAGARTASSTRPQFPAKFVPPEFAVSDLAVSQLPGEPAIITTRRAAMKTVANYNVLMVRLASGQTVAELSQSIDEMADQLDGLRGLLSAANPFAVPIADSLGRLAGLAEALRADAELRDALIAGQEPVNDILDLLRDDAAVMYDIFRDDAALRLNDLEFAAGEASATIVDFVASNQRPNGALATQFSELERRYAAAGSAVPGLAAKTLAGRGSGPAYDRDAQARLGLMIEQFEAVGAEYQSAVAAINGYHAALGAYVRLLDQVKRANVGLVTAAQRRTVTLDPLKVMTTATAIRQDAATILAGL